MRSRSMRRRNSMGPARSLRTIPCRTRGRTRPAGRPLDAKKMRRMSAGVAYMRAWKGPRRTVSAQRDIDGDLLRREILIDVAARTRIVGPRKTPGLRVWSSVHGKQVGWDACSLLHGAGAVSAAQRERGSWTGSGPTGKNHIEMASLDVSATYIPPPASAKG